MHRKNKKILITFDNFVRRIFKQKYTRDYCIVIDCN